MSTGLGHGDGPCNDCAGQNIIWFTESTLWNNVVRADGGRECVLCLPCFIKRAEAKGYRPTGWHVLAEWPIRQEDLDDA